MTPGSGRAIRSILNLATDVVRQTAVRERHVWATLKNDNLGRLVQPSGTRREAHATGNSSNNNNLHFSLQARAIQQNQTYPLGYVWSSAPDPAPPQDTPPATRATERKPACLTRASARTDTPGGKGSVDRARQSGTDRVIHAMNSSCSLEITEGADQLVDPRHVYSDSARTQSGTSAPILCQCRYASRPGRHPPRGRSPSSRRSRGAPWGSQAR